MQWTGSKDGRITRWRDYPSVAPEPSWLKQLEHNYWNALDLEIKAAQRRHPSQIR